MLVSEKACADRIEEQGKKCETLKTINTLDIAIEDDYTACTEEMKKKNNAYLDYLWNFKYVKVAISNGFERFKTGHKYA